MTDEELFIEKYGDDLLENIITSMIELEDRCEYDTPYGRLFLSSSHDHEGGLEGYYRNDISGSVTLEDDLEIWYFNVIDSFCSETKVDVELDPEFKVESVKNFNNEGDLNMTTRKLVTVTIIDQNPNVPTSQCLVAKFEDVVCQGNTQATLLDLVMNEDVKGKIDQYNEARTKIVDRAVLERTGSEVKLQPVTLQDLEIQVK